MPSFVIKYKGNEMIKANRLILSGDIIYDNVKIYKYGEPGGHYISGLFERYQLFIKTNIVKATISMDQVSLVQIRKMNPKAYMMKVKRMVMNGQVSFGPAWLIPEDKYAELDIPFLFKYDYKNIEHHAFIADGWLYLTKDESVISIEH